MEQPRLLHKYIHDFHLDEHLNPDLLRCLRMFHFAPQMSIYTQADEQTYLYLLVAGQCRVSHFHPNGKLSVLARLSPLAVIGDLEVLEAEPARANVITIENVILLGLEKTLVRHYGFNDPRFLRFIIHHLTIKLYQSSRLHMGQAQPLINRLAAYLLYQGSVVPKADLAALLGTTPRHLNRVIKTLEAVGAIKMEHKLLHILDRAMLEQYAEETYA